MRTEALLAVLRRRTPLVAVDEDGIRYLLDTSDRGPITLRLLSSGTYERPLMERALALLERLGAGGGLAGRAFVDVGANIGTATLCALIRFRAARALALEPDPDNFRLLRMNLVANDVDDRTVAARVAVSERAATLELERATHNIGDHRIRTGAENGAGAIGEAERGVIPVEAVGLDAATRGHGIEPGDIGLVWVDVQGHEPQVLAGATGLIESGVPLVIEYWPYGLKRAGGLERLHQQLGESFTDVWDLGEEGAQGPPESLAPDALASHAARYPSANDSTNLLLRRG
jgi:FkbM family methyltransferase